MGASIFATTACGRTPDEAFRRAVDQARFEHGHGGYTGTVAEKHDYTVIQCPSDVGPRRYAAQLIDAADPRVDDKYGPAGCIEVRPPAPGQDGEWLFFGWASD